MPRISAESVAAHVAAQEAAVVDAMARLVARRGVGAVSMADIATEVGLARNSLYRYFPDRDHILGAWFRRDLAPLAAAADEVLATAPTPTDAVLGWVALQLDVLTAPEHRVLLMAVTEVPDLASEVREGIAAGHRALHGAVAEVVAGALEEHRNRGRRRRDAQVVTSLVVGLLRGAVDLIASGADRPTVETELRRSVRAVLAAG